MALIVTAIDGRGAYTASAGVSVSSSGIGADAFYMGQTDFLAAAGIVGTSSGFEVTQTSPATLGFSVKTGTAYVLNSNWTAGSQVPKFFRVDNTTTVTGVIGTNVSGNPRIDKISLLIDTATAPNTGGTNIASITVTQGTPAASPSEPATPNNALMLATVTVTASATSIVQTNITDKRFLTSIDLNGGWTPANETWTYASADDPTFTFTISGDVTSKYTAGMRIRISQTTTKYFIITRVVYSAPNTTITVYGGTDYDLTSGTILAPFYSMAKSPAGFPGEPTKWSITTSMTSNNKQTSPGSGTWYNLGGTVSVPIGSWRVDYSAMAYGFKTSATSVSLYTTLSTANNTESDTEMTLRGFVAGATSTVENMLPVSRMKFLNYTSKTVLYLNIKTDTSSANEIAFRGDSAPAIIRVASAYL